MEENNIEENIPKKKKAHESMRENPWIISTFVLGLLVVIMLVGSFGGMTGGAISESDAGETILEFANSQGADAELIGVEKVGLFYKVTLLIQEQEVPVYVTRDGKYFTSSLIPLENEEEETPSETETQDIPKSDKPVVELFIMSHCPYGTQAEKGILPVVELLGDKIDFNLRFVYYAMHPTQGEVEEQLNQYCIQEEQEDKLNDYLKCFLGKTGTPEDGEACLTEIGIDKAKLNTCYNKADKEFDVLKNLNDESSWLSGRYPLFNIDKDLNEEYGIGGSPGLVINGAKIVSSPSDCSASDNEAGKCVYLPTGRDPASYLDTICQAFNDAPEECGTQLQTTSYSPGFGYEGTGASTTAQCG